MPHWSSENRNAQQGFTLLEALIAILILTFGLLAAGQLIYLAAGAASLARSKGSAAIAAQDKLEFLADLNRRNPGSADLTDGMHGPERVQVHNRAAPCILNQYDVTWTVSPVADPRPGKDSGARQVAVTVAPVDSGGNSRFAANLNKFVTVSTVFSRRIL